MRATPIILLAAACVTGSGGAWADVSLPAVFSDHMVLQRDMPVRIFGTAQPGEAVTITLKDAAGAVVRTARSMAGQDGVFNATLEPMSATEQPMTLDVAGVNTVTVRDVLVGEVWVAGGQSNMEWPVRATGPQAAEAVAAAQATGIRLLKAPHVTAYRPQSTISTSWAVLSPETVPEFSAVAFWFARDLREALGVPVGILSINWGGTRAEPWVDLATLGSHPRFEAVVTAHRAAVETWESTPATQRDEAWRTAWAAYQQAAGAWWGAVNERDPGATAQWFAAGTAAAPDAGNADGDTSAGEWGVATLPQAWSATPTLNTWDGTVWYRRAITIPDEWAGKECLVETGAIDDCDVLFVNGAAVANTISGTNTPRRYRVPGALVTPGQMLLTLQVLDLHGEGGVMAGPMRITCPGIADASVALDGEWQFRKGRTADGLSAPPARPAREAAPGMRPTDPAALYHAMIAPFAGYTVRGAIWYQGESNAGTAAEAAAYADLLPLVVRSWRAAFERPDMPFGIVSLAAFRPFNPSEPQSGIWPALRESQLHAESQVPNVGVITTIDVGDAADIHPRDKRTVGTRLAAWARANAYAHAGTAWRGPRVARSRLDDGAIVLEFDVERTPLAARGGGAVQGFALAGQDGVYHWATAEITSPTTIRVSCPQVPAPVEVRYAWQDNPQNANLVDSSGTPGLPAHPFRHKASQ